MASTDSIPVPRKNVAYRLTFALYKNDGTLITGAAGLDSEVSKDGGTFADCTNEATEIATNSGFYYLDLTSTEMNADCVAIMTKTSSTGAVIPTWVLYPQETGDIKVDVTSLLGTAWLTPGTAGTPDVNVKLWNGLATVALPLVPTTAGRTLDVSAGGEAGIDWSNIGSPTTAVNLSATNIDVDQVVASVSGAVGSVTGAVGSVTGNVGGNVTGSVGSVAANGIALTSLSTTAQQGLGLATSGTLSGTHSATTADLGGSAPSQDITGMTLYFPSHQLSRVITSYNTGTGVATFDSTTETLANSDVWYLLATAPSSGGSGPSAATIADAVWDELLSGHAVSGSAGEALSAAGTAGDPWTTALPGAYGSGTAGKIIGDNITGNAYTRLGAPAGASVSADIAAVKVDSAAILVDTGTTLDGRIPAALVGGRMDASVGAMAANVMTAAAAAADLTTELQSGLATSSAVSTLQTSVDDLPTNAELATALGTADDAVLARLGAPAGASIAADIAAVKVDTAAVKSKTDSLTFTVAGQVDANTESINGTTVLGDGSSGDKWRG